MFILLGSCLPSPLTEETIPTHKQITRIKFKLEIPNFNNLLQKVSQLQNFGTMSYLHLSFNLRLPLLERERERELPPDFREWADDDSSCYCCPKGATLVKYFMKNYHYRFEIQ